MQLVGAQSHLFVLADVATGGLCGKRDDEPVVRQYNAESGQYLRCFMGAFHKILQFEVSEHAVFVLGADGAAFSEERWDLERERDELDEDAYEYIMARRPDDSDEEDGLHPESHESAMKICKACSADGHTLSYPWELRDALLACPSLAPMWKQAYMWNLLMAAKRRLCNGRLGFEAFVRLACGQEKLQMKRLTNEERKGVAEMTIERETRLILSGRDKDSFLVETFKRQVTLALFLTQ